MKIELHAHTSYSRGSKIFYDGIEPPERMVGHAKKIGLGAIAITDHNTMLGIKKAREAGRKHGIIVISGEEIGSSDGHTLAVGIQETIRPGMGVEETVDLIHQQGGAAIAVHPFDIKHDGLRELASTCDAVEIFNGNNVDRISNIRARNFALRNKMIMTAGSDAHMLAMLGSGVIKSNATDVDGVIRAIKKGKIDVEYQYPSVNVLKNYAITKLKMSYDQVYSYMDENYNPTKKFFGKRLLGLVEKSPGNIDRFFDALTYFTLACVVTYSFWQNGIRR